MSIKNQCKLVNANDPMTAQRTPTAILNVTTQFVDFKYIIMD